MTVSMRAIVAYVLCTRLKFIFVICLYSVSYQLTRGKAVECESLNVAFEWPALFGSVVSSGLVLQSRH